MNFVTEICIITTTASLEHCYDFLIFLPYKEEEIKKKNCCLIMNTFKQFCVSETDKTTWTCDVVTHKGKPTTAKCEKMNPPVAKNAASVTSGTSATRGTSRGTTGGRTPRGTPRKYNMFERDKNGEYTLVQLSEKIKTTEHIPKSFLINEEEKGLLDIYIKKDGKPVIISANFFGMVYIRFTPSDPVEPILKSYDILLNTDRPIRQLELITRLKSVQPIKSVQPKEEPSNKK
mgnify:CR=1 FL=1